MTMATADAAEREALIVLSAAEWLGPIEVANLVAQFGSARATVELASAGDGAIPDLIAASVSADGQGRPIGLQVAAGIVTAAQAADTILADVAAAGLATLMLGDPGYPPRLAAIAGPPHVLFVRGDSAALAPTRSVAVVGTRRPTNAGRLTASRIATALARVDATLVSGLAIGIDGAAHAATVAEDGKTIAAIAGGHGRLFPKAHQALASAIVGSGGAVISEHPPRTQPSKSMFPRRNRLISGLADAIIVVEAGSRSGALITAAWALEQGRGCFLVPGAIDAPMAAGCLAFLRECAGEARIVAGIPQLLEDLGMAEPLHRRKPRPRAVTSTSPTSRPLPPSPDALLKLLPRAVREIAMAILGGHSTPDELVAVTDMPIAAVLSALTILETRGLVTGTYGRYHPAGPLVRARLPKVPRRSA